MKQSNAKCAFTLVAAFGLTLLLFAITARATESTAIASSVCLDCHEDARKSMLGTIASHDSSGVEIVACVGCHVGPATAKHVDDPDTYKPLVSADLLTAVCTSCHKDSHALNLYERDPHGDAKMSCDACHEFHSYRYAGFLKGPENTTCLSCHASVRSDFALPTHHPVMEGVVACRDCHTEIAQSPKRRKAGGPTEACLNCHGRMQGPFPFEHEPAVNYSANEGGCMNCHSPHGSGYPMLLKQSYDSPHNSLCSQCHTVPGHLNNMQHGTTWASVPCYECHTDIHGSYTNRHLLDPSLQSQGCLKAGCHK